VPLINLRVKEELKKKLEKLAAQEGKTVSQLIRELIEEKIAVTEIPTHEEEEVPDWVPNGSYVALVKGAVVSLAKTASEAAAEALSKFPEGPIRIVRKGPPPRRVEYAFLAEEMMCWPYLKLNGMTFPVIPIEIIGRRRMTAAALPDTAASITLIDRSLSTSAGLKGVGKEVIQTVAGAIPRRILKASISVGRTQLEVRAAEIEISPELPFQVLLGRNVIDRFDLFFFGKRAIVCIRRAE